MTLSEKVLNMAVGAGLCAEHTRAWDKKWTAEEMLRYYKTNPNWCMERRFPPLDLLKKNRHHELGIYVDEEVALRTSDLSYLFVNCNAGVITNNVVRLYFSLGSKSKIIVEDGGDLFVDMYDDSYVEIELKGNARCIVYQHGKNRPVITGGKNYKIRDKRK